MKRNILKAKETFASGTSQVTRQTKFSYSPFRKQLKIKKNKGFRVFKNISFKINEKKNKKTIQRYIFR